MLVDKINASGGVLGQKLELIIKDSGGSPEKAVSFAKQLIEEDKVLAIIGPSTSGETMQIKKLCEENQMILVSCAAADAIVNPLAKYVFKTPQKDSQAATWIYRTMKEKGITKIAVLTGNDGFGASGKKQLEELAKTEGIEIVANEVYDKQATDLTDILTKVKSTPGVQAVVNWSIVPAQSIVAKNMKQLGMNIPLFQSHGFGNPKYVEQAGVAAEGILFPAGRLLVVDELPASNPQKHVLATYKKDYEAAYKEDVSTFGGHAYDAILILTEALKKAGNHLKETDCPPPGRRVFAPADRRHAAVASSARMGASGWEQSGGMGAAAVAGGGGPSLLCALGNDLSRAAMVCRLTPEGRKRSIFSLCSQ